jgi:pyruvate kinase
MVTLGVEAADDPYFITRLVQQGADVVRINCAHDDENVWAHMLAHARTAEQKLGRRICILMDIAGPKVRTLDVTTLRDRARLLVGDELLLRQEPALAYSGFSTGCTIPEIFGRLKLGDRVSLDDGKLRGKIIRQSEEGLVARFEEGRTKGLRLKPEKGLNFPDVDLGLGRSRAATPARRFGPLLSMTHSARADIATACPNGRAPKQEDAYLTGLAFMGPRVVRAANSSSGGFPPEA